jgi:hypothetical protein
MSVAKGTVHDRSVDYPCGGNRRLSGNALTGAMPSIASLASAPFKEALNVIHEISEHEMDEMRFDPFLHFLWLAAIAIKYKSRGGAFKGCRGSDL